MTILITTMSILGLAGLAWAARKALALPVCPVCTGVAGTWLWMLAARELGYAVDGAMLAVLMGATVAGTAYQLEKRLPRGRSPLLWKTLFLPVGFAAAYGLVAPHWAIAGAGIAGLFVLTGAFLARPRDAAQDSAKIEELEKQMKRCC